MCMRAANEVGVGQPHQLDIVDIAALARDEPFVFLAHNASANAFNAHVLILPTGDFCCPTASIEGGGLNSASNGSRYSAACATFMRPAASSTAFTMLW